MVRPVRRPAAGFTLLEMVLALGILMIIVSGIGASVVACLQATDVVHQERLHQTQCDALQSLLSHSFLVLPTDAILRCTPTDVRTDEPPPLRFHARQPSLIFTSLPEQPGVTSESAILFRRQANGMLTMSGANTLNDQGGFLPADSLTAPSLKSVPLIREIKEVKWRFYDSVQGKWLDRWEKDDTRPTLVELSLGFAESPLPFIGVFWLPSPQVNSELPGQTAAANPASGGTRPTPSGPQPTASAPGASRAPMP